MGVPRDPVRLVDQHGERKMIQPASGRDLTKGMQFFTHHFPDMIFPALISDSYF